MGKFLTEKETEEWLTLETRCIPLPDGTTRPFTGFKLMWRSWDYLILTGKGRYTPQRLVELATINSQEMGYSFDDSLPTVLAYLHRGLRKAQGID